MQELLHDVTRHLSHWASLVGIIIAGLWGLVAFSYDRAFQSAVAISIGVAFVAWGVTHHWLHENLHAKVVFEYLVTAICGIVILLALIWYN